MFYVPGISPDSQRDPRGQPGVGVLSVQGNTDTGLGWAGLGRVVSGSLAPPMELLLLIREPDTSDHPPPHSAGSRVSPPPRGYQPRGLVSALSWAE